MPILLFPLLRWRPRPNDPNRDRLAFVRLLRRSPSDQTFAASPNRSGFGAIETVAPLAFDGSDRLSQLQGNTNRWKDNA
jgi:hypothetical protein